MRINGLRPGPRFPSHLKTGRITGPHALPECTNFPATGTDGHKHCLPENHPSFSTHSGTSEPWDRNHRWWLSFKYVGHTLCLMAWPDTNPFQIEPLLLDPIACVKLPGNSCGTHLERTRRQCAAGWRSTSQGRGQAARRVARLGGLAAPLHVWRSGRFARRNKVCLRQA